MTNVKEWGDFSKKWDASAKHYGSWTLSPDLEIETSVLRRSISLFNFEISFSKFEIVLLDEETSFASLIDSLCNSENAYENTVNLMFISSSRL